MNTIFVTLCDANVWQLVYSKQQNITQLLKEVYKI